jgi:hypothetical protein
MMGNNSLCFFDAFSKISGDPKSPNMTTTIRTPVLTASSCSTVTLMEILNKSLKNKQIMAIKYNACKHIFDIENQQCIDEIYSIFARFNSSQYPKLKKAMDKQHKYRAQQISNTLIRKSILITEITSRPTSVERTGVSFYTNVESQMESILSSAAMFGSALLINNGVKSAAASISDIKIKIDPKTMDALQDSVDTLVDPVSPTTIRDYVADIQNALKRIPDITESQSASTKLPEPSRAPGRGGSRIPEERGSPMNDKLKNLLQYCVFNTAQPLIQAGAEYFNDLIQLASILVAAILCIKERTPQSLALLAVASSVGYFFSSPDSTLRKMTDSIAKFAQDIMYQPSTTAQFGHDALEDCVTGGLALFTAYVSCVAGKNSTSKEIFKNITQFDRVKGSLTDIINFVIEILNQLYNWIQKQVGGEPIIFLTSNEVPFQAFEKTYLEITTSEEKGEFYRNPTNLGILKDCILRGTNLIKGLHGNKLRSGITSVMQKRVNQLEKLLQIFVASNIGSAGARQEPVGILIRGGPGVGKSILMQHINYALLAAVLSPQDYVEYESNPAPFIWNRQAETVFWDGITPKCKIVMFDDLFQAVDIAGNPDAEPMNIIRAINGFENILHCAEMTMKGNVRLNAEFVTCTTNATLVNTPSIISNEALMRRFPISVICVPQLQYCTEKSIQDSNGDLYKRRFDINKLPSTLVDDSRNYLNPEYAEITTLNPYLQEYYDADAEGKPIGNPYGFNILVQRILKHRQVNRRRHLAQQAEFTQTAQSYRDLFHVQSQMNIEDLLMEIEPEADKVKEPHFDAIHALFKKEVLNVLPQISKLYKEKISSNEISKSLAEIATIVYINDTDTPPFTLTGDFVHACLIRDFGINYYKALLSDDFSNLKPIPFVFPKMQIEQDQELINDYLKQSIEEISMKDRLYGLGNALKKILSYAPILTCLAAVLMGTAMYKSTTIKDTLSSLWEDPVPICNNSSSSVELPSVTDILDQGNLSSIQQSFGFSDKMRKKQPVNRQQLRRSVQIPITEAQVSSSMDLSGSDLIASIVTRNMYKLYMERPGRTDILMGYTTMIIGTIGLIPIHFIKNFIRLRDDPNSKDFLNRKVKILKGKDNDPFGYILSVGEILDNYYVHPTLEHNDICLVNFKGMHPHRSIIKNFCSNKTIQYLEHSVPTVLHLPCKAVACVGTMSSVMTHPQLIIDQEIGDYTLDTGYVYIASTNKGDCGGLLGYLNPANVTEKILGFHVAGSPSLGRGFSAKVTQEDIIEALKDFPQQIEQSPIHVDKIDPEKVQSQGRFNYIGALSVSPSRNMRTELTKSPLYMSYGQSPNGTAQLKAIVVDGVIKDPLKIAQSKYCLPPVYLNPKVIESCRKSVYSYLLTNVTRDVSRRLLTIREALDGMEGEINYGKIPSSTSPGYPMNTPGTRNLKAEYFQDTDPDTKENAFQEICRLVHEYIDNAKQGIRTPVLWTDALKDEKRPIEKVVAFSTRMFSGCSFIYQVVYRIYFGSFTLFITENKVANGFATGVNPYSEDWHYIVRKCAEKSPVDEPTMVGAGDYSKFDGSQKPQIHEASVKLINEWYNDDYSFVRRVICSELTNSFHVIDGEVYEWCSSLPSGHPGTIIFNGLYNQFAFRYCWVQMELPIQLFNKHVYLIVQGDDNVFAVVPQYREQFNEITLVPFMKEIGLTYTTETKGNAVYPFRQINEIEFLKRQFIWSDAANTTLAPLRLDVILDIPRWMKMGAHSHSIVISNTVESMRELSLHTKDTFNYWKPIIFDAFRKLGTYEIDERMLLSYEEMQELTCHLELCY